MENKILLVLNPIAGDKDKEHIEDAVRQMANKNNFGLQVYKTTGKEDKVKILSLLDEEDFSRIFIAGGDGTIREVADAIKDRDLLIGLFPSGSANGLALNLNIPEDLEEQLEIAMGGTFLTLDILEVGGHTSLHISDFGVNAALIKNYEKSDVRGKLGYLLQAIPTLTTSKYPFAVTVKANDKTINEEVILVAIANAKKFGTGANINPTGKLDDGIFEVLLFKNFDISEILKTFYGEIAPNSEFVTVIKTTEARITCEEPLPFQIDGEFMGDKKEIVARMRPEKLKILSAL
ncbi:diacylglycerol/lipid kinase family protein [Maribacter sp. X9]|uniref:diacylglycerol/lipid kinase family protein n=1 Tax=Maribacter sp. X9 TaxID=3402159 RepID=UPI003AF38B9A